MACEETEIERIIDAVEVLTNFEDFLHTLEVWKPSAIEGYFVSNLGRVKTQSGELKKLYLDTEGRFRFWHKNNIFVHRLVATAFVENPNHYSVVVHLNGISTDNRAENLKWASHSEIAKKSMRTNDRKIRV